MAIFPCFQSYNNVLIPKVHFKIKNAFEVLEVQVSA